jgi:outer membrane protease
VSLDGILQRYESDNLYLNGLRNVYETVASLGYQATNNIKVSGDISYGSTPVAKGETRGLLRAEYRFGFGKKGGQ